MKPTVATRAAAVPSPSSVRTLMKWFDQGEAVPPAGPPTAADKRVEWLRIVPFIGMHGACLGAFVVGWQPDAVTVASRLEKAGTTTTTAIPGATRQKFFWWEIHLTSYGLVTLQWLRVIRDLRPVPRRLLEAG